MKRAPWPRLRDRAGEVYAYVYCPDEIALVVGPSPYGYEWRILWLTGTYEGQLDDIEERGIVKWMRLV